MQKFQLFMFESIKISFVLSASCLLKCVVYFHEFFLLESVCFANIVNKVIRDFVCFGQSCSMIGQENLRHTFNQPDAKTKN